MMPRLQAERALGAISQIAAGTGSMKDTDQRTYLGDLRQAASGGRKKRHRASYAEIAGLGIKIKRGKEVSG